MTPVTIVTGASSGIGAEFARVFARHGHSLVLVARRRERLEALAAEIAAAGGPKPLVLVLDVAERDIASRIRAALEANGLEAQYIVNNAGYGLSGRAAEVDRDMLLGMVDLNVRALTELALAFIGSLERHRGGILNVGSVAGFVPGPGSIVYYASKAYVQSFSEALGYELRKRNIRVTVLCPGPVQTEFHARSGHENVKIPKWLDQSAVAVAEAGYHGLMRGRRVVVPGFGNKIAVALLKFLPHSLTMSVLDARRRRLTR